MERPDHDPLDDETPVNPTSNPTFRSILAARLSRRGFIAGAEDWLRDAGGGWLAMETVVEAPAGASAEGPAEREDGALAQDARRHFQQAMALGAEAAAHVGLAGLARLEGDLAAAARHLSAARAADPSLPVTPSVSSTAAVRR